MDPRVPRSTTTDLVWQRIDTQEEDPVRYVVVGGYRKQEEGGQGLSNIMILTAARDTRVS